MLRSGRRLCLLLGKIPSERLLRNRARGHTVTQGELLGDNRSESGLNVPLLTRTETQLKPLFGEYILLEGEPAAWQLSCCPHVPATDPG